MNSEQLQNYLGLLGLDEREAELFAKIAGSPAMSVLQISRVTGIPRTSVYRMVQDLTGNGFLTEVIEGRTPLYRAIDGEELESIVQTKEEECSQMKKDLPDVVNAMSISKEFSDPETRVVFYKGVEGIKQMVWNILGAKGEVTGYSYRKFEEIVGDLYTKRFAKEFSDRKLNGRDVFSDQYIESAMANPRADLVIYKKWDSRYVPAIVLDINHQMDVYDDVVAIYNWHKGEIFGLEIHNQKTADFQKQMFEIIWGIAKPYDFRKK